MKRVALYVRVSTQEQAEEGYSIGAQTERLKAYCKARDWMIYDEYIDPGFSGSNTERPALNKLIRDAVGRKFDLILVYKLDRLSRSQKDTLYLIEDVFNKNEIDFVSINENFDTSTAFGRAMIGILSVFAQLEREQIKERTAMGRAARAKDGLFHGGGYDPLGYDYIDGKLVVNEYEALQIRKIYELFLDGWTFNAIMKFMSQHYTNKYSSWNNSTRIRDVLRRESLTGAIVFGGNTYVGQHEPIIDVETFQRVQKRFERIRNKNIESYSQPYKAKYLLTGLLVCGHCGGMFYIEGNTYRGEGYVPLYTCYSRGKTNKKLIMDPNCKNTIHRYLTLDQRVINEIISLSFNPSEVNRIMGKRSDLSNAKVILKSLRERLAEIDKQSDRMIDLYQVGSVNKDNLSDRMSELEKEKRKIADQIQLHEKELPKIDKEHFLKLLRDADVILNGDDKWKKRELVHSLIDNIMVDNDNISIHWAFE